MAITSHIKVQRGSTVFGASATSIAVSITAVNSLAFAFARVTGIAHGCATPDAGGTANRNNLDDGCHAVLTALGTVTLTLDSGRTAEDRRVYWEVWEFTGPPDSPYRFDVLQHGTLSISGTTADGAAFAGTDADIAIVHCGQINSVGSQTYGSALATLALTGTTPNLVVRAQRSGNGGTTVVGYAVVQFSGSKWEVQRISSAFAAVGTNNSVTISDIHNWANAMILPAGHRLAGTAATNASVGGLVWPGVDTTHVRTRINANHQGTGGTFNFAIVYAPGLVVVHADSQTGGGTDYTGGGAAPQTFDITISTVNDATHAAAVAYVDNDSTATSYPSPHWIYTLENVTTIRLFRARTVGGGEWAVQGIDFNLAGTEHLDATGASAAVGVGEVDAFVAISLVALAQGEGIAFAQFLTSLHAIKAGVGVPHAFLGLAVVASVAGVGVAAATVTHFAGGISFRLTRLAIEAAFPAPTESSLPTLPAIPLLGLPPNWEEPVRLRSAFSTDVAEAEDLSEDRRGSIDRPSRTLTCRYTALQRADLLQLWAGLMRLGTSRVAVPLWCDQSKVLQSSSGTTIYCTTADRRFFVGHRIAIFQWQAGNRPGAFEFGVVRDIFPDHLVLEAALVGTYAAEASRCFPALDAEVNLQQLYDLVTDRVAIADVDFGEVDGPSSLPALVDTLPPGFTSTGGVPILTFRHNFQAELRSGIHRKGRTFELGRSVVVEGLGARPLARHELHLSALSRADAFAVLRFLEFCRGRLEVFWFVPPHELFEPTAIASTHVDVVASGTYQNLVDFVKSVAIVGLDGTLQIRDVASTTDNGSTWRITFASVLTTTPAIADVRHVTSAHKMRLEHDDVEEVWSTDETCDLDVAIVEVFERDDVALSDLPTPAPVTGPDTIPDLAAWFDACVNTWMQPSWPGTNDPTIREERCQPYPHPFSIVHIWDDVRLSPSLVWLAFNNSHRLVTFSDGIANNSRPTIENSQLSARWHVYSNKRPLWSPEGFTLFLAIRTPPDTGSRTLVQFDSDDVSPLLEFLWREDRLQVYETKGVTNASFWVDPLPSPFDGSMRVLVARVTPGFRSQVYYDGVLVGESAAAPSLLPMEDLKEPATLLDIGGQNNVLEGAGVGLKAYNNAVAFYKRALDDAEVNELGRYFADRFGGKWTDL